MTFPSGGFEATPGKWARRRRGDFPDLYIADGRVVAEDGIPTTKRHGALLLTDRSAMKAYGKVLFEHESAL